MRALSVGSVVLCAVAACQTARPPGPAPVREPAVVRASFGKTWDAVIDIFAEKNIAIRTIDRSSGLIAADPVRVPRPTDPQNPAPLADCGVSAIGYVFYPGSAIYNVLVRGDSVSSSVRVTVRWVSTTALELAARGMSPQPGFETCSTKGVWEGEFEQAVRERAEAKASTSPF
ncbi:MAG TPA: hypothetical protein VFS05_14815 [Gemmatimonadaceae bacterium]|nr:hypothetical protein [Gemmatimonadaceae bacterium]